VNFEALAYAQQATGSAEQQGQGGFMILLPMYLIIFAIFYFFLIRPQKKRDEEKLKMISDLKKNDEVITAGGMHGTVVNVKDKTIVLKVDEGVKIEFDKTSVITLKKSRQG
jgi:preprotein translocase subunit YajC